MSRTAKLLAGLDLQGGQGLEIGALHNPVLPRDAPNTAFLDHAGTAALRAKYAGHGDVPADAIVDVAYIWTDQSLADVVGERRFHHVIASHVIEHVPDIIWWLSEIAGVLQPFGTLRLAVPDKRYTFDFLRRETTIVETLAAWVDRRRAPGARELLDFWANYRAVDAAAAWRGDYPADTSLHMAELPAALRRAGDAGAYHDCHCSVFTPVSFARLMRALAELEMLPFACTELHDTAHEDMEFFVHMMRSGERAEIEESWRWAEWKVTGKARPSFLQKGSKKLFSVLSRTS